MPGQLKTQLAATECHNGRPNNDPCELYELVISSEIEKKDPNAFHSRSCSPMIIRLTGNTPPSNLAMWIRGGIWEWDEGPRWINRDYEKVKIFYPANWNKYFNREYFDRARREIKEPYYREGFGFRLPECELDVYMETLDFLEHFFLDGGSDNEMHVDIIAYDPM